MAISRDVRSQLRSITAQRLIDALLRDGWVEQAKMGAKRAFKKSQENLPAKRVVIHYHPKRTYGIKLLTSLLGEIGWTEDDLARLKLIKRKGKRR